MLPSSTPDSAIRRLMRDGASRQRPRPTIEAAPAFDLEENVELTIRRLGIASTEMDRLRTIAASQQSVIYDQKQELANVRREMADACAKALRSDQLLQEQKTIFERVEAQCEAEIAALRSQIARLTAAVTGSFDFDETVTLRAVA